MKTLTKKSQMLLYALAGMGVNMLNLMMGSYLCSAIIAGGFTTEAAKFQTFQQTDLVIAALWTIFGAAAKILDGVVDIPMASFADNLRSRFGRRRPAILIGLVPTIIAYLLFLVVPNPGAATVWNTIYLGVILCLFYSSYTLTMVTYYATFTEIVDNTEDRNFISNAKSVFDIIYFILGYVLVPAMLKGINIQRVAVIILPIALTMLIPIFMIKEGDNRKSAVETVKSVNLFRSIQCTVRNKPFMIWMVVYAFMTFGVQLFLSGINEYFSATGFSMMTVMMGSFAPVPFTLIIYNKLIKRKGFGFAFRYVLACYGLGMIAMFAVSLLGNSTMRTVLAIVAGVACSLAIGALFSVAYSIPSELAAQEEKRTGISNSAMYFAVQGLFSGVATAIGSYVVLTILKKICGEVTDPYVMNPMYFLVLICALGMAVAYVATYKLPQSVLELGKEKKEA